MVVLRRAVAPVATLTALVGLALLLVWSAAGPLQAARSGEAGFEELLTLLVAAVAALVIAWTSLVLATVALAALPGGAGAAAESLSCRLGPGAATRLARLALGLTVAAGPMLTLPAGAAPGAPSNALAAATASAAPATAAATEPSLPGIRRPGPVMTAEPAVHLAPEVHVPEVHAGVVVRRGDSLWAIAARRLGADATDAQIATEWPRWYSANRDVIGADPNLLMPGTVLHPPGTPTPG